MQGWFDLKPLFLDRLRPERLTIIFSLPQCMRTKLHLCHVLIRNHIVLAAMWNLKFYTKRVPDRPKRAFSIAKKHVLAIDNVQFTFYIVILAIRSAFLWQSRTRFIYQIGRSRLPLIRCRREPNFSRTGPTYDHIFQFIILFSYC